MNKNNNKIAIQQISSLFSEGYSISDVISICSKMFDIASILEDDTKNNSLNNEEFNKKTLNIEYDEGSGIPNIYGTKEWWLNNRRHRLDGPAIEYLNGYNEWYLNGQKITEEEFFNKRTLNIEYDEGSGVPDEDGDKFWYLNDKLHRLDGPAIEHSDGYKAWYINGLRHREDGPAIEYEDGDKEWYLNGKLHRLDGPAVEWADGSCLWYLDDKELSEEEWKNQVSDYVQS